MNEILIPVLLVAGIGLVAGLGLAVASIVMAVPKDEKAEEILAVLPGANCGACGFSGCSGYAAALAKGEAKPGLCAPGGADVAAEVSKILGVEGAAVERQVAVVHCMGSYDYTSDKMEYQGIRSCAAAALLAGGVTSCRFGCMGMATAPAPANMGLLRFATVLPGLTPSVVRAAPCALRRARNS